MADLKDILVYLISNYPANIKSELSNARITKMVYLADWRNCIKSDEQISKIRWYFDNYGPFVNDVLSTAEANPDIFRVRSGVNMYGKQKRSFELAHSNFEPNLSANEINSLDHIIAVTKKLQWSGFIKLVYGTHPIASSERYEFLDLKAKAREYSKLPQEV